MKKIHTLQWGETEETGAGPVRTVIEMKNNSHGVTSLGMVSGFEGKLLMVSCDGDHQIPPAGSFSINQISLCFGRINSNGLSARELDTS